MNYSMSYPVDNTINGECNFDCGGKCCSAILLLTSNEILKIKKYLKKHPEIKPTNYTPILSEEFVDKCPFLDNESSKCKIYEVRPEICKRFICSKYKNPDYKPMNYNYTKVINMLTTFTNLNCPQAPDLTGLNNLLGEKKREAGIK